MKIMLMKMRRVTTIEDRDTQTEKIATVIIIIETASFLRKES